jgi:hypothetical protein
MLEQTEDDEKRERREIKEKVKVTRTDEGRRAMG